MSKKFRLITIFEMDSVYGVIALIDERPFGVIVNTHDPRGAADSQVFKEHDEALNHYHSIVGETVVNGWKPVYQGQPKFG
jgi:hypothetical protein